MDAFNLKFEFVAKALSLSRGQLAMQLGIDKSVVSRWLSGARRPTSSGLARLTALVAGRVDGFTMLDWDLDLEALAVRLAPIAERRPSAMVHEATPTGLREWQALPRLHEAMLASGDAGQAAAGLWRALAPMPGSTSQFGQSFSMFRVNADGSLRVDTGFFTMRRLGWSVAVGMQFFSCVTGTEDGYCAFTIMNRTPTPTLDVMDGIFLGCMADNGGVPIAMPLVMERIGDLTGDDETDEARLADLLMTNPVLAAEEVAVEIRKRLAASVDPSLLTMAAVGSLARGRRSAG